MDRLQLTELIVAVNTRLSWLYIQARWGPEENQASIAVSIKNLEKARAWLMTQAGVEDIKELFQ